MRSVNENSAVGIVPCSRLCDKFSRVSFDNVLKDDGMDPDIELYAKERYCRSVNADKEDGIG